jgi:hypothetical protein
MTTRRSLRSLVAALMLCLALGNPDLFAQGTDLGTIRGTVTDPSGAVIVNAQVQVTDQSTLKVYSFTTNTQGVYQAPALPPGRYKATITAPGFSISVINGIVLNGSDVVSSNATLHAVAASESVQVTSEGREIDTVDSTLSETLSPKAVIDLPRDSRDIYQFLYINPNITQGAEPGDFKFIAAQSYGASFSVDGQRSSGGVTGTQTQSEPSLEAVGELNVLSNSFSAEYAGVANIRVNTKRGGAQYHGSLFYNNSNSALGTWTISDKQNLADFAPTPFQATYPKSYFNITDAGGSFGGPIPKVKNTWFFLAYEHNWTLNPIPESNETGVPHPTLLTGNFSLVADANKPDVPSNVILTSSEIAQDTVGGQGKQFITIPQRLLNPITQKLIAVYFPSIGAGAPINPGTGLIPSYSTTVKGTNSQNMGDLRIDHDFNEANRLYGVYHGSSQDAATSPVAAPYTGLGLLHNTRLNSTLSLSYTHVFSSHFVNEVRGGYNTQDYYIKSNTTLEGFLQSIGFSDADITAYGNVVGPQELLLHGNPAISFGSSGITTLGNGGRSSDRNLNQGLVTFGDTLTWAVGRHTLNIGGDFVRNAAIDGFAASRGQPLGELTYTGIGLDPFANFLLGSAPTSATYVAIPRPAMDVHNWENGYYVQDDFRVNPRLTLNLGMRYDLYNPYIEKNDLLANFDPNYRNPATGQVGVDVIPSTKTLKYLAPSITDLPPNGIGYVLAKDSGLGVGRGLVRTDKQDFGPRIGGAYSIREKTVLRGGFGLYYPTSSAHIYRDSIGTNPFSQAATKRSVPGSPISGWPVPGGTTGAAPITGGQVAGFSNVPSANYVPVNLKNPRLYEWNATVERKIPWQSTLRASYIGGHQVGQIVGVDLDEIPPSDIPFGTTEDPTGNGGPGDGHTPCDPTGVIDQNGCNYSAADKARIEFPALGDYVIGFGNRGNSLTTSFQVQAERQARGLTVSLAYTYLNQKSSGLDNGNDSLAGEDYNPFQGGYDYTRDSWVSPSRFVAYGIYDLPFGRGERFASSSSRPMDAIVGGWQASFNMFAKSGTAFTPFWDCGDCDPVMPGNVASGAVDAVGDFNNPSLRPKLIGNPRLNRAKGFQFNPTAFTVPDIGSTLFSDPLAARRNTLNGPGTYGVNLGVHKSIHVTDRVAVQLGADIDNVLNHPMLAPDENNGGGGGNFARLGTFNLQVNRTTPPPPGQQPALLPINTTDPSLFQPNPTFGQLNNSYSQEGVSGNRAIRLRGRITF